MYMCLCVHIYINFISVVCMAMRKFPRNLLWVSLISGPLFVLDHQMVILPKQKNASN